MYVTFFYKTLFLKAKLFNIKENIRCHNGCKIIKH